MAIFGLFHCLINRIYELFITLLLPNRPKCHDLKVLSSGLVTVNRTHFHTLLIHILRNDWERQLMSKSWGAGSSKAHAQLQNLQCLLFHCLCLLWLWTGMKGHNVNATCTDKKHMILLESLKHNLLPELSAIVHYFIVLY